MAATTAYSPSSTRSHHPAQAATAALAGLTLATAVLAGSAWHARSSQPATTATHSAVDAPLTRTVGAGDDPYEVQGNRRPEALVLPIQAPVSALGRSLAPDDDRYEVSGNRRPDAVAVTPEFRAYQARQQALARR
jgi:hypothetical protein